MGMSLQVFIIQCNPDIREILSGPKLEPVLPK